MQLSGKCNQCFFVMMASLELIQVPTKNVQCTAVLFIATEMVNCTILASSCAGPSTKQDMAGLSVICLSVCMTVCQSVYHLSVGRVGLTVTSVLSAAINLVMYSYLLYFCFPFRKDLALKYFLTRNR